MPKPVPFARALHLAKLIQAAGALGLQATHGSGAFAYESHGHGRGSPGRNFARLGRGKAYPFSSTRQDERTLRNAARGLHMLERA